MLMHSPRFEDENEAEFAGQVGVGVCWAAVSDKDQMVGNLQIRMQFLPFSFFLEKMGWDQDTI